MTNANAIAYVSIGAAQKVIDKGGKCTAVDLDGVKATMGNVANGSYPLCRSLNLLTKGEATGVVKEFIDYLIADQGQKVVGEMDFVTVRR
jgi:phosphate transport system substrate-binding protein